MLYVSVIFKGAMLPDIVVSLGRDPTKAIVKLLDDVHLYGPPEMVPQAREHSFT